MKFVITVDTEADNQWKKGNTLTMKNIQYLPRFQKLCEQYGFIPTYLVSYEIAADPDAVALLKEWQDNNKVEIGSHLHPWSTPPQSRRDKYHRYPSDLSDDELNAKLTVLTDEIKKNFGKSPTSYRAGRWGFDKRQENLLSKLGYRVDSSITPSIDWSSHIGDPEKSGGPDFRKEMSGLHLLDSGILEIPMTILPTGIIRNLSNPVVFFIHSLKDNLLRKVLNRIFTRTKWMRVFNNTKKEDWQNIYKSAEVNNLGVIQFMIHSSELMPGGSPYSKTHENVEFIYKSIEELFKYMKAKAVTASTLSSIRDFYDKQYTV